jgi:hypothetical protein
MSSHGDTDVLRTAAKITMIFVAIVWVFAIARDGGIGEDHVVVATDEAVIEAPQGRKRILSAVAAPGGEPVLRQ